MYNFAITVRINMKEQVDIFYKNVALNVKKKRIENNKTQLNIAYNALSYDTDSYYSQLENSKNEKHFNLKQLFLISEYLNCSIKDFFNE